jgi:hypothetical protein
MKDGLLLFAAIGFALAELVRGQSFAGEYADKNYQNGGAAFHMSIEGSGNNTQGWFSVGKNNGAGSAPEGQGTGKINSKGALEFKFEDSCHNAGTGIITRSGADIIVSMTTIRKTDAGCAAFYGQNFKLKRVKK